MIKKCNIKMKTLKNNSEIRKNSEKNRNPGKKSGHKPGNIFKK